MAKQLGAQRRVLRDLVPATLATGAAGLVVALVVGGTTGGLQSALSRADEALPTYADSSVAAAGSLGADDVTVQVRPSLPAALPLVALFDAERSSASSPTSVGRAAPASVMTAAAATDTAVQGVFLDRFDSTAEPVAAAPPATAAPEPPAAATAAGKPNDLSDKRRPAKGNIDERQPDTVRAAGSEDAAKREPSKRKSDADKPAKPGADTDAGASSDTDTDTDTGASGDAESRRRPAPPDHAPARGHPSRNRR
mgnify:CR=1 FL=1